MAVQRVTQYYCLTHRHFAFTICCTVFLSFLLQYRNLQEQHSALAAGSGTLQFTQAECHETQSRCGKINLI